MSRPFVGRNRPFVGRVLRSAQYHSLIVTSAGAVPARKTEMDARTNTSVPVEMRNDYVGEVRRSAYMAGFRAGEAVREAELAAEVENRIARASTIGYAIGVACGAVFAVLFMGWLP